MFFTNFGTFLTPTRFQVINQNQFIIGAMLCKIFDGPAEPTKPLAKVREERDNDVETLNLFLKDQFFVCLHLPFHF